MSKNIIVLLISFFLTSFPFKSFSGQWIELDSSWFGSDWYYDSDARMNVSGSVMVWLSEYFDDEQQTKNKNGKIYRYNEIRSYNWVKCYNKTVWTEVVQLWLNGSKINSGYLVNGIDLYPDIDYGIKGNDYFIKFSGNLKSPLKKLCKIYD